MFIPMTFTLLCLKVDHLLIPVKLSMQWTKTSPRSTARTTGDQRGPQPAGDYAATANSWRSLGRRSQGTGGLRSALEGGPGHWSGGAPLHQKHPETVPRPIDFKWEDECGVNPQSRICQPNRILEGAANEGDPGHHRWRSYSIPLWLLFSFSLAGFRQLHFQTFIVTHEMIIGSPPL